MAVIMVVGKWKLCGLRLRRSSNSGAISANVVSVSGRKVAKYLNNRLISRDFCCFVLIN